MKQEVPMDDYMRELVRRLGEAINASVRESEEVQGVIEAMNEHGYSVHMLIDATIGVVETPADDKGSLPEPRAKKSKWTSEDKEYLRALKIAV